jgi:hypothetical protein
VLSSDKGLEIIQSTSALVLFLSCTSLVYLKSGEALDVCFVADRAVDSAIDVGDHDVLVLS